MSTDDYRNARLRAYVALLKPIADRNVWYRWQLSENKLNYPDPNNELARHLTALGMPHDIVARLEKVLVFIPFERFVRVERLGRGGFSTIYKGTVAPLPGRGWAMIDPKAHSPYAVKFSRFRREPRFFALKEMGSNMLPEFILHMCTTTLSSVFFNETTIEMWGLTKSEHGQYMIIMQYAPKGCADTRSLAFRDWQTALQDAYCIADLLSRLHRQELVHKDLHCGNVVFNRSGKASLVDLGLSQLIQETHNEDGIYGRLEYIPPEVIDGHPYTMESDVYCLGTLIWQLVVGVPPRGNAAQAVRERRDRMREEDIPGAPEGFMEIVRLCWNPNPDRRPPAEYVSGFLLNLFTEQSNRRTLLIWILYHSFRLRLPRKILPVKPSRDTRDFIASRRAAHLLETGSAIFGPEASATSAAQRTPAYTSKFYTTQELYRLSLR